MCHWKFPSAFLVQLNFIYLFVLSLIRYEWKKLENHANLVNKFTDEHFTWQKFYFLNKNENKWENNYFYLHVVLTKTYEHKYIVILLIIHQLFIIWVQ